ncbi:MAG: hypothetical protein QW063_00580 [Candidatus Nanoarchaeia archaeon]
MQSARKLSVKNYEKPSKVRKLFITEITSKSLTLIFLVMVIVVSGCISLPIFSTREIESETFIGGTDGLVLRFLSLPSTVLQNQSFSIVALVENKGESDINAEDAFFTLNNANAFNIPDKEITKRNSIKLTGAKLVGGVVMPGGSEQIAWGPAKITSLILTEQQIIPLSIDACYPYTTTATSRVCISKTHKLCEPVAEKIVKNSGAPIQLTSLRQIALPKNNDIELTLIFEIKNVGGGAVFEAVASCPNPNIAQKDYVNIKAIKLGGKSLDLKNCSELSMSLFENKGSASCTFTIPATTDYEEQLTIELEYKYKKGLSGQVVTVPI